MYFQDSDRFLVNRHYPGNITGTSSTMTARSIKDIVNPVGNVEVPEIIYPTEQQGFPVQSSKIMVNSGVEGDTTLTLELFDLSNLDLIGAPGETISEVINSSEPYTPISTRITIIDEIAANQYKLYFSSINYDIALFKVGETIKSLTGKTATIDSIDRSENFMDITSSDDWTTEKGGRVESQVEITATATLVKYDSSSGKNLCYLEDVQGHWIDKYNNRSQRMVFDTTLPKGGSHVDMVGSTFIASPFVCDNPILKLTEVIWRLNGVEYKVPIVDETGNQEWEVPTEALLEGAVNTMSVVYVAGQNRSKPPVTTPPTPYPRRQFIPKNNPFRIGNTVSLLNTVETYTTEVTTLGL